MASLGTMLCRILNNILIYSAINFDYLRIADIDAFARKMQCYYLEIVFL